jgi:glutamate-1-semialdehyde 2,1-aminomutase
MTTTETPATGHNALARSLRTFKRAQAVLPGGTTRVTVARTPTPIYATEGKGAWLTDLDGNRYLDLNNNFTTLIHGHAFEPVIEAVERQLRSGACFANPTEHEVAHAELLCARVPVVERVRYVNTGTEAVMFAIKAARALTGRSKIAKFEGAYHGGYDWVEVSEDSKPRNWGPDNAPASVPFAKGTPESVLEQVVPIPFNNLGATAALLKQHGPDLACMIVDMTPSRAGLISPLLGYMEAIREITHQHGVLLVSDEVLNFRQSYHGAAARFGIEPDLITFGKIIGGGLPVGAIGGPAAIMSVFDNSTGDPPLPQGGTFSANPLSMVAGLASMRALDEAAFARLEQMGEQVRGAFRHAITSRDLPLTVTGTASLFRLHMRAEAPTTYREAFAHPAQAQSLSRMTHFMLERGVIMPSATTSSLSTAMVETDIQHLIRAFEAFLDSGQSALAADA